MYDDIIKPKRRMLKATWDKEVAAEMFRVQKEFAELAEIQPMPDGLFADIRFQKASKKTKNRPYRRKI